MKEESHSSIHRSLVSVVLGILPIPILAVMNLVGLDLWIRVTLTYLAFILLPGLVALRWLKARSVTGSSMIDFVVYANVIGLSIMVASAWILARAGWLSYLNITIVQEILLGGVIAIDFLFPKNHEIAARDLKEALSDFGFVALAVGLSTAFLLPKFILLGNGLLLGGDDAIIARVGQAAFTSGGWPNLSGVLHPYMSPADIAPGGPLAFGTFGAVIGTNPIFLSSFFAVLSATLATLALCLLTKRFNDEPVVKYGIPIVWLLGYAGAPFFFNLTLTFAFAGGTPEGLMSIPAYVLIIICLVDMIRKDAISRIELFALAIYLSSVMLLSQLTLLMAGLMLLSFAAVILKVKGPRLFLEGCAIIASLILVLFPPYLVIGKAIGDSPAGKISSTVLNQLYYPYASDPVSIIFAVGIVGTSLLIVGVLTTIFNIGKSLYTEDKSRIRLLMGALGVTLISYSILSFTVIGGSLLGIGAVRFVEYIPFAMIPIVGEGLHRIQGLIRGSRFVALGPILLLVLIGVTAYSGASFNVQTVSASLTQPNIFNYWQLSAAQWLSNHASSGVVVADMNNGSSNAVFLLNFADHPVVYRDKSELYLDIYGNAPPFNLPYYYANLVLNNPNSTNTYKAYKLMNFTYYFLEIPYNSKQIEAFTFLPYMQPIFANPGVRIFQYTGFMQDATFFIQATNYNAATKGVQAQYVGYGALNSSVSFPSFPNAISSISPSGQTFDGNSTSYVVNVPQAGNYSIYVHRLVSHTSEYLVVSLNQLVQGAVFSESLGWGFGSTLDLFLPKGQDILTFTFEGTVAWASPMDYLVVAPGIA